MPRTYMRVKDGVFHKWNGNNCAAMYRKIKLDLCLTLCMEINSNGTKDFNVRTETVKFLENSWRKASMILGWDNDFFGCELKGTNNKTEIDKCHYIKLKSSGQTGRQWTGRKANPWNEENVYKYASAKGSYPKYISNNSIVRKQLSQWERN